MQEERKRSLLDAALFLFAIYGPENVSADMIAFKAKCSHGLLYHYFNGVEKIYQTLWNSQTNKELRAKLFSPRKNMLSYAKLTDIVKTLLEVTSHGREETCFALLALNEKGKGSLFELLTALARHGQKEGDVTGGDPSEMAKAFLLQMKGMYMDALLNEKGPRKAIPLDLAMNTFRRRSRIS